MHTRCAPVRHSHPPEGGIPYDLHVLGLPLAFILSQDQTLRCSIAVLVSFPVKGPPSFLCYARSPPNRTAPVSSDANRIAAAAPSLSCAGLKLSKNSPLPLPSSHPSPVESGCKNTTFPRHDKHFFQLFFIYHRISLDNKEKKFTQEKFFSEF